MSGPPTDDPRVHFSKETETWRFEDDDGKEMEWDQGKGAWVPLIDEDMMKAQQAAYTVPGVDEETPAAPIAAREKKNLKRKAKDYTSNTDPTEAGTSIKRGKTSAKPAKPATEKHTASKNTAVYVTGLPPDTMVEEMAARFGKCGVIMEDDDEQPRIKLYADAEGNFNGEALVVFFKEESVTLAINLLDEAELRLGESTTVMSVRKGEFGHKAEGGNVVRRVVDKKKATKRIIKLQSKLTDWDSEDEFGPSVESSSNAQSKSRVVLLKHMFTLKELEEDATLLLDLKEEVREECETLGEVTNVVLYDKESDGIMTVKFREPLGAQACVVKMNGRFFAGRQVIATLFDGKAKFKKSGGDEVDEDEKKRLDAFANWLEKDGGS